MWQQKQSKPWMLTRPLKRPPPCSSNHSKPSEWPMAMASDGHSLAPLGPPDDEAEIDQRGLGAIEMADEIGKDAGVEAPAMNEDETHLATLHGAARGAAHPLWQGHPGVGRCRAPHAPR